MATAVYMDDGEKVFGKLLFGGLSGSGSCGFVSDDGNPSPTLGNAVMSIESQVLETLRTLPPERQAEVLDFVEFIKHRTETPSGPRPAGLCEGEFVVPEDFDDPLPESVLRGFES